MTLSKHQSLLYFVLPFLLFTTGPFSHLLAQDIDPIAISEEGHWVLWTNEAMQVWDPDNNTYVWVGQDYYRYYFSNGDTLIGGVDYIKMYEDGLTYNEDGTFYKNDYPYYSFAYRNDQERKAYKIDQGQTTPYLWYDFNGGLNETVANTPTFSDLGDELLITNLTTITICDTVYQWFHFNGAMDQFSYSNAIQRAGNTRNFIENTDFNMQWDTLMYFCEGTDAFDALILSNPANGIDEYRSKSASVFPNPCSNQLTLQGVEPKEFEAIYLYDCSGRFLQERSTENTTIDVSDLSPGVYLLTLTTSTDRFSFRFCKK